jgi:phosphoribosylamine--glycine ligase
MRTLIVGHGAREAAMGRSMAVDSQVHAFMAHANPSLIELAGASGGAYELGDVCDPDAVAEYATRMRVDLAMVSADEPLAAGVVDVLLNAGIPTMGATRAAAEIEWSKIFARRLLVDVDPDVCPHHVVVAREAELDAAVASFGGEPLVVKPVGLTGGKGVKVMDEHLSTHGAALAYARALVVRDEALGGIVLEERLEGPEFTIQAVTDGTTVVCPPATYDYPYRYKNDHGPGTGGMGAFSVAEDALPFLTQAEYDRACETIRTVVAALADRGRPFSGVLNAGFFATDAGVRVTEFNARFGDPECINIMALLKTSWTTVAQAVAERRLRPDGIPRRRCATVVLYLVAPSYPEIDGGLVEEFELDREALERCGCDVLFAACEHLGNGRYRTVGTSRTVALAAAADTLAEAREIVMAGARSHVRGSLEWREDVADPHSIAALARRS